METTILNEPRITEQTSLICKEIDATLKSIECQLETLGLVLKRVSFMINKYQFDKFDTLKNKNLHLQHSIKTCLILRDFGLYDSIEIDSPYDMNTIMEQVKYLEVQFNVFKNELLTRKKTIVVL